MRLIDADAVREALYDADAITMRGVAIINRSPTIDDAPVVRWIPVTEQLPEQGQEVIVCVLHRFGNKTVCWKRFWGETHFSWQDVTHWMPMPEPPMRKGENDNA